MLLNLMQQEIIGLKFLKRNKMSKLKLTKTASGKPKLIDNNGLTVATAPNHSKGDFEYFERLLISYNLLAALPINFIKNMKAFSENDFKHPDKA